LEKTFGLDPNDPIIPFIVLVGSSATLWYVNFPSPKLSFVVYLLENNFHKKTLSVIYFIDMQGLLLVVDIWRLFRRFVP